MVTVDPATGFTFGSDVPDPKVTVTDDVNACPGNTCFYAFVFAYNTLSGNAKVSANPNSKFPAQGFDGFGCSGRNVSPELKWSGAPAGTEARLENVQALAYTLTDLQNGALNPLGVNCLRTFPIFSHICWGARTLDGADQLASEWKYIPIRRLALFIEESLFRGTKWVVFEPNDEPLWAQIRLNVGVFMNGLFRQGAFQGSTPQEAYFVKCDKETTTQADRNLGIVNIEVGFAPLKPAEFVVITIQQIAGELQV